jgi:hypothetical protein
VRSIARDRWVSGWPWAPHAGALQLAAIRPLLQAYLSGAVYAWYRAKFASGKAADRRAVAQATGALVGNTNALFPIVAIQIAAPGVAMVVFGTLLWDAVAWRRGAPETSSQEQLFKIVLLDFVNPKRELVRAAASAGGFAAAAAHGGWVLDAMALCRLGVLR